MKRKRSIRSTLGLVLAIFAVVTTYAYGFAVTDVDFATTREETRREQFTRVSRSLAKPNIFEYDQIEQIVDMPIYLPCPESGFVNYQPDRSGPYISMEPACGSAEELVTVKGFNMWPNVKGPLSFVAQSGVSLRISSFATDESGYFELRTQLPGRQPVAEAQTLRAIARRNTGTPRFTEMALNSWDRIVETVFMALLATTVGTLVAIPISFMAARNLMANVRLPLTGLALSMITWPLGIFLGIRLLDWSRALMTPFSENMAVILVGVVVSPILALVGVRWALPAVDDNPPTNIDRFVRSLVLVVSMVLGVFFLIFLSNLALNLGIFSKEPTENFAFFGHFVFQLGDLLNIITGVIVTLTLGSMLGGLGAKLGVLASDRFPAVSVKAINLILAPLSGYVLMRLLGAGLDWFYQFENPAVSEYWPGAFGIGVGLLLALLAKPKAPLTNGTAIYIVTRAILNATRSIEPLIMAIVFVVWLGIGPFAGAMALGLHTIASLGKLFSEQVENISDGPLEAIQATGANRLQTIIYAVVPQIIPPYISFTMYRWDINVRMSTIIGFVGGGGIGLLLVQNIKLLQYRDASVQMVFIAIVVASMDIISATLRERYV